MRYGKDIVARITEELRRVPSIMHVCKKVGIDRSTFYRWMAQHFDFHKEVEMALIFGRKNINDAAESVIINGIQKGDINCAKYWLGHNEDRYVEAKQVKYFQHLQDTSRHFFSKQVNDTPFDPLFDNYFRLSDLLGSEHAKEVISPLVEIACHTDPKLVDIFYAAYEEWKAVKLNLESKVNKIPKSYFEDIEEKKSDPS